MYDWCSCTGTQLLLVEIPSHLDRTELNDVHPAQQPCWQSLIDHQSLDGMLGICVVKTQRVCQVPL